MGGWALARLNQTAQALQILERFFKPNCPRLREDLSSYRRLTLMGLLDCALAQKNPWLALAYIWQLKAYPHALSLLQAEAQLLQYLHVQPSDLVEVLIQIFKESGHLAQFRQQALAAFALLSLKAFPRDLHAELGHCLGQSGYVNLARNLNSQGRTSTQSLSPVTEKEMYVPGEAQWRQFFDTDYS